MSRYLSRYGFFRCRNSSSFYQTAVSDAVDNALDLVDDYEQIVGTLVAFANALVYDFSGSAWICRETQLKTNQEGITPDIRESTITPKKSPIAKFISFPSGVLTMANEHEFVQAPENTQRRPLHALHTLSRLLRFEQHTFLVSGYCSAGALAWPA